MAGNHNSGRRRVPAVLNQLHGNPSNRPFDPADEPRGKGVLWSPPPDFDDEQREEWHYALEHAPASVITGTDRNILALWCVASAEHRKARSEVRRRGQVVKTKDGNLVQNPYLRILNNQAQIMLSLAVQLGFSPAARTSLVRPAAGGGHYINGRADDGESLDTYLNEKPDRLQ